MGGGDPPRRHQGRLKTKVLASSTSRRFHRAVAGTAAAGNNVVMDHVLIAGWRLQDCLSVLVPHNMVLVGVHCPVEELERRERERGDRPAGIAARRLKHVHAHGLYDVACDTGCSTARECALHIKEFVPGRPRPTAFERLRSTH